MAHCLTAVLPTVIDNPVSSGKIELSGDLGDCLKNMRNDITILRRNFIGAGDVLFGNYQKMNRRLGVNVVKRQDLLIFVNLLRRDLPRSDFAKQAIHPCRLLSITSVYHIPPDFSIISGAFFQGWKVQPQWPHPS